MGAVPFHLHPRRAELMAQAPQMAATVLARAGRGGKVWDKLLDVPVAIEVFRMLSEQEACGDLRAVILGDSHLLCYSVGAMWFMPGVPMLIEQFFMRIGRGPTSVALQDVDDLALAHGCKAVIMATSLAADDEALGRLLGRFGYTPQSSQHLKVL